MTKLEKALENIEDVKRVLIQEFCPAFFGLKNNCNIARDCEKCWNQEADEMTHTPGKWYVGYDQEYDIDAGYDGRTIGYPTGRDEFDGTVFMVDGEDQIEIIAEQIRDERTAHLIAAAPDLLEALEAAKQFISNGIELGYISMPEKGDTANDTLGIIDEALTLREGRRSGDGGGDGMSHTQGFGRERTE